MINKWIISKNCLIAIICIFTLPVLTMEKSDSSTDSSDSETASLTSKEALSQYLIDELNDIKKTSNFNYDILNKLLIQMKNMSANLQSSTKHTGKMVSQVLIFTKMTLDQTEMNEKMLNYLINLNNKSPQTLENLITKPKKTVITRFRENAKKQSQEKLESQNSNKKQ